MLTVVVIIGEGVAVAAPGGGVGDTVLLTVTSHTVVVGVGGAEGEERVVPVMAWGDLEGEREVAGVGDTVPSGEVDTVTLVVARAEAEGGEVLVGEMVVKRLLVPPPPPAPRAMPPRDTVLLTVEVEHWVGEVEVEAVRVKPEGVVVWEGVSVRTGVTEEESQAVEGEGVEEALCVSVRALDMVTEGEGEPVEVAPTPGKRGLPEPEGEGESLGLAEGEPPLALGDWFTREEEALKLGETEALGAPEVEVVEDCVGELVFEAVGQVEGEGVGVGVTVVS